MTIGYAGRILFGMSIKELAQVLTLAAGVAVVFPAAAASLQDPSCDGDKSAEEKKKPKNPSLDPSCGDEKNGTDKKGDDKS